jgi:hypothetical protein
MSWTDIFPVLSNELVADYQALVTQEERMELESWLGVERIFPAHPLRLGKPSPRSQQRHLVSATLF